MTLLIYIGIGGFLLLASVRTDDDFCDGIPDGIYFDPENCAKFYICANGFPFREDCPPGLLFDPFQLDCDWPKNVDCTQNADSEAVAELGPASRISKHKGKTLNTIQQPLKPRQTLIQQGTAKQSARGDGKQDATKQKESLPSTDIASPKRLRALPARMKNSTCKRRVCYFTNWAHYRPQNGSQYPGDIMDGLCTHIMYAFATFNQSGMLHATDGYDEPFSGDIGGYQHVIKLKDRDPSLKVLLSVGGWNMGSRPFQKMVRTKCTRAEFITSTISFLRDRGFDGIDIDWEYPANRGSPKEDKQNYALLLQELRREFDKEARETGQSRLLMTAAVAAGKANIDTAYEVPVMNAELDFISLMSYDLHGSWDAETGHCSPLYAGSWEHYSHAYLNINWTAEYWVRKGVSRDKLVIGMSLYGRSFNLKNSSDIQVGASVTGAGEPGPYTHSAGFLSYYEVCSLLKQDAHAYFIEDQRVPFLVHGDQWVGYDDEISLREKVRFTLDNGFGGVMTWSLGLDDFKGLFCDRGRYPLIRAINDECGKVA